ncbi:MAG: hypothetical protein A3G04_01750 [Candidatus Taylorbacteria bacterium RIFCSPLOWO2_12_FULL_44_9]|nr:MAG: hypothetical protein A3G04_01750 [Candidatus Taylorbacteria bacterium RIFCSPLOWO2_12_FULL_44_9]
MLTIKKMKIKDFRSFVDEEVSFDDVTTIVGANEGGKTNVLDAIEHLTSEEDFKRNDLRKGSKNYPYGQIEIEYSLILNAKIIPELIEELPILENREFIVVKKGKPDQKSEFTYRLVTAKGIEKIISIKKTSAFRKKFDKEQIKLFEEALKRKWFVKKPSLNLTYSPFPQLKNKEKAIDIISDEQKINSFLSPKIFEELRGNVDIYFWKYEKDAFLKNITPIKEFVENPDNFLAMKNLFIVAGWKQSDFKRKLVDVDANDATVLMKEVEKEIQKLIKKTWRQHKDLAISLQHRGDSLLLHLQELTAPTPPEIRSDGLKWFLSFLINFRAKSEQLSDFIVLIDEPALHLHPRGQKDVLSEIKELAGKNQIIYTTHQTFMIDRNHVERVRILTRESIKSGGHDYYFASKVSNEIKTKNIMTDPLLRESLGFNVSDISPINEKNILVEGSFDRGLIYLLNRHFPTIDLEKFSIIACDGASDIKRFANFCLSNDLSIFCIYDSDESGVACYSNNSENAIPEKLKTHLKSLSKDFKSFETPEDLFPLELFQKGIDEVSELKGYKPDDSSPKMKQLQKFFDGKSIKKREDKNEIKHKLEDALLGVLRIELEHEQVSSGSNLIKLLTSLGNVLEENKI